MQLAFKLLDDFNFFEKSTIFHKNRPKDFIIGKGSLSFEGQTIIWLQIIRGRHCLRNDCEQIYSFVNISTRNSYEFAQMSANSRNCTFSEISDPGVECFAPFSKNYRNQYSRPSFYMKLTRNFENKTQKIWKKLIQCRKMIFQTSVPTVLLFHFL